MYVLSLFHNTGLALHGPLFFQINFKLSLLNSSRNSTRILIGIALNKNVILERIYIILKPSHFIQNHKILLFLFSLSSMHFD